MRPVLDGLALRAYFSFFALLTRCGLGTVAELHLNRSKHACRERRLLSLLVRRAMTKNWFPICLTTRYTCKDGYWIADGMVTDQRGDLLVLASQETFEATADLLCCLLDKHSHEPAKLRFIDDDVCWPATFECYRETLADDYLKVTCYLRLGIRNY